MSAPPDGTGRRRTARLQLDLPAEEHLPDLVALWRDPVVTATLGGPRDDDAVRGLLDAMVTHRRDHGWGWWILRDRADGTFLGYGGIRCATFDERPEVELGYAFVAAPFLLRAAGPHRRIEIVVYPVGIHRIDAHETRRAFRGRGLQRVFQPGKVRRTAAVARDGFPANQHPIAVH